MFTSNSYFCKRAMLKAIIFDMDDVILNSKRFDYPAWKRFFSDFGLNLTLETYKSFLGMKNAEIIKKHVPLIKENDVLSLQDKKELYFIELLKAEGASMTEGLTNFLDAVKDRYLLAIATSAPQIKVNEILKYLRLEKYFKIIITADQVSKGKPNPELFLKAAENLKINPRDCVVIEDAPNGVKAAKEGGMKCVAITTTHKREELKDADIIINRFSEINQDKLEKLFK